VTTGECRYPGGLKERPVSDQLAKAPEEILRRAVYGMLPKNNLRKVLKRDPLCQQCPATLLGHARVYARMHGN
jgi:hypothetical protein